MSQQIGYDELLFDRVKQLKAIYDQVDRIWLESRGGSNTSAMLASLKHDISRCIQEAEAEHAAF